MSRNSVSHLHVLRWSFSLLAAFASLSSAQVVPVPVPDTEAEAWRENRGRQGQGRQGWQARPLFEFRGRVDREVHIVMRGREAWVRPVGRTEPDRGRVDVDRALPRDEGHVRLQTAGRGDIDVIQQPSARNRYTTVVRIRDPRSGASSYRVAAYWIGSDYGYGRGRVDDWPDRDDDWGWERPDDRGNGPWGWERNARPLVRWSGEVDDHLEIRIQGDRVTYRTLSGKGVRGVRVDLSGGGVRRGTSDLRIVPTDGRGSVYVAEQPSERNGYATVIRVRDSQSGYGRYAFTVVGRTAYATR
jgi:hypothetical protein